MFKVNTPSASTDENCRLALQLAVQLPESREDAREVVDELASILERYLIRTPRPIWERRVIEMAETPSAPPAVFWTVAVMLTFVPIAVAMHGLVGVQVISTLVMMLGVVALALVFGRAYGICAALIAIVAHNLFIVPPLLELSMPTTLELVFAACHLIAAAVIPEIAARAPALRAAAMISCVRRRQALEVQTPD